MRKLGEKKWEKFRIFPPRINIRGNCWLLWIFCNSVALERSNEGLHSSSSPKCHGCRECPWMPLVKSDYVKGALWLYRWLWSKATKDIIVRQLQLYVIDHDLYCPTYFHRMCWTGVYCLFARSVYVFQVDSWPRYIICVWLVLYECVVYWSRYAIHSVIPQLRWLGCLFCIQQ